MGKERLFKISVNFVLPWDVSLPAMKTFRVFVAFVLGLAVMLSLGIPKPAMAQTTPSAVRTETQPGFSVVGISVPTTREKEAGGNGEIPQLWQRVMQQGLLENVPHRTDNNLTVVYTDYSNDANGEYTYLLGVRVSGVDKVPDGMVVVNVPAGKYAVVRIRHRVSARSAAKGLGTHQHNVRNGAGRPARLQSRFRGVSREL